MIDFSFWQLKDNPNLFDYNVHERVNDFVAAALAQVTSLATVVYTFILFPQ